MTLPFTAVIHQSSKFVLNMKVSFHAKFKVKKTTAQSRHINKIAFFSGLTGNFVMKFVCFKFLSELKEISICFTITPP